MTTQLLASPAAVKLHIEVVGSDLDGQHYIQRTHTVAITRDGATIVLANKLAPESELIVRNLNTNEEAIVRVVGHIREDSSGHLYGIALTDPSVDLWRIPSLPPESLKSMVLECSRCHIVKTLALTEIEMEIYQSKHALTHRCECSGLSTIWKETTREESTDTRPQRVAAAVLAAEREQRRHKRTAVKAVACIRCAGQEEIVECEDMSRGGFRFKGRKRYPSGTQIEVAMPYVQSTINLFVPGEIAYHQELSAVSHRHGVAYRRSTPQK
jgi:hypothetical protein